MMQIFYVSFLSHHDYLSVSIRILRWWRLIFIDELRWWLGRKYHQNFWNTILKMSHLMDLIWTSGWFHEYSRLVGSSVCAEDDKSLRIYFSKSKLYEEVLTMKSFSYIDTKDVLYDMFSASKSMCPLTWRESSFNGSKNVAWCGQTWCFSLTTMFSQSMKFLHVSDTWDIESKDFARLLKFIINEKSKSKSFLFFEMEKKKT